MTSVPLPPDKQFEGWERLYSDPWEGLWAYSRMRARDFAYMKVAPTTRFGTTSSVAHAWKRQRFLYEVFWATFEKSNPSMGGAVPLPSEQGDSEG